MSAPANHPYLIGKCIAPCGTRIENGKLLVAMRDVDGKIWSLQEIHPSGDKRNQKNGFRRGCFFQIGEPGETFCIGEGFATCATLHKATEYAVFCAGDAGNLEPVARALREKYPGAEIIVCGDDDWLTKVKGKPHNTGKLAAGLAAEAVNGVLALPWFSESARPKDATDFNDMARLHGLDEVRTTIRLARIAHEEEQERRKAADIEVNLEHPKTPGVEPEPPRSEGGAGAAGDHMDVPGADSAGPAKDLDPNLAQMNATHAVVSVGGKFRVMTFNPDSDYPRQSYPVFSTKDDFSNHVVHPKIEVVEMNEAGATKKVKKGRGAWWLAHPRRRIYDGIDFIPGGPSIIETPDPKVKGRIIRRGNLWSGFSVEPAEGDCSLYLDHAFNHVCQGSKTLYDYVLNWMASGVQKPYDPARAALSMRGEPGAGKGVFAREYGKIFGRHFSPLTQRDHIVGKFNAHTAEACLIFADEALFAGDPRDADILKTLISEEDKHVERKYIDPVRVRNYARLIFASNHDHALRIEANDRRYCALHTVLPDDMAGPAGADKRREYFTALVKQMENGGRAALLHMLLRRGISNFNPEAIPQTEELAQQKLLSASPADQIIIQLADNVVLPGALITRPWIARSNTTSDSGGLFDFMRKHSGKALDRLTDNGLSEILKRWGFTKKKLKDCNGWEAPELDKLREQIKRKYPAVEWTAEAVDWGQAPQDTEE